MPVEIRELVIKATVGNPNQGGSNNASESGEEAVPKKEIIQEAVAQVMEILQDKKER